MMGCAIVIISPLNCTPFSLPSAELNRTDAFVQTDYRYLPLITAPPRPSTSFPVKVRFKLPFPCMQTSTLHDPQPIPTPPSCYLPHSPLRFTFTPFTPPAALLTYHTFPSYLDPFPPLLTLTPITLYHTTLHAAHLTSNLPIPS